MPYTSNRAQFEEKLERAIIDGMNKTLGNAVAPAKAETPVRTGTAQGSIKFTEAKRDGDKYIGEFGSYKVNYFIWLEIGARGRSGIHMLRRAADLEFPKLMDNIKAYMR